MDFLKLSLSRSPSAGSYTDSQGISVIRQHVADFITQRDGPEFPADPSKLFLLNGATEGIKAVFYMCMNSEVPCGAVIPIPQYPIYTASIAEFGAVKVCVCIIECSLWFARVYAYTANYGGGQRAVSSTPCIAPALLNCSVYIASWAF